MNIDWKSLWDSLNPIITFLGSGLISILITNVLNEKTQIKAIKESGLYIKRADVLDELMKRMERLDRLTGELVSPFQVKSTDKDETKRREKTAQAFISFNGFYRNNIHYLPKKISEEIENICQKYKKTYVDYVFKAKPGHGEKNDLKKWQELVKDYENNFSEKKEKIADEFRKIIGVK